MNEFRTEKAIYTAHDFMLWESTGMLVLTPKFQRRPVWKPAAKSFFVDTLLRGMTVPPLYLRLTQNAGTTNTIREVVDGQQRIRAVLDFINDDYRLSKTLSPAWANKKFTQLTLDEQRQIKSYGFAAEIFGGISDQQVLEVFCRLNTNGIPLNKQELRNGKFFGHFKQSSYSLAYDYLEFWRSQKVFTELSIARMLEVELTSELLIASNIGMQDKKSAIDTFYEDFEEAYLDKERDKKRFNETMQALSATFGSNGLSMTEFRRPPLFYSLYCVVYHHQHGLPSTQRISAKKKMTPDDRASLRGAVENLSDIIFQSKEATGEVPRRYAKFIDACSRQTDNIIPRKVRFDCLYDETF